MGGSIGLALQQRGLARRVVGVGRRASSLRKARQFHTVTHTTTKLERGVADANLIVVCTPVADIVDRVCEAAQYCPAETLITDVGSTKSKIVQELDRRLRGGPGCSRVLPVGPFLAVTRAAARSWTRPRATMPAR